MLCYMADLQLKQHCDCIKAEKFTWPDFGDDIYVDISPSQSLRPCLIVWFMFTLFIVGTVAKWFKERRQVVSHEELSLQRPGQEERERDLFWLWVLNIVDWLFVFPPVCPSLDTQLSVLKVRYQQSSEQAYSHWRQRVELTRLYLSYFCEVSD